MSLEREFQTIKTAQFNQSEIDQFFQMPEQYQRMMLAALMGQRDQAVRISSELFQENYQLKAEKIMKGWGTNEKLH